MTHLVPASEIPAFAVIARAIHERGETQREAFAELDARGLRLSEEQKRQAGLYQTVNAPIAYDFAIYNVRRDAAGGMILTQCSDGASAYFQPGDEVSEFEAKCDALEGGTEADAYLALSDYLP